MCLRFVRFVSSLAILTSVTLLEHCSCEKDQRSIETEGLNVIESLFPHFTIRNDSAPQSNAIKPETRYAVDLERLDEKDVMESMLKMQRDMMKKDTKDEKDDGTLDEYDMDVDIPPDWDGISMKGIEAKRKRVQEADLERVIEYINGSYIHMLKNGPGFNSSSRRMIDTQSHQALQTLFPNSTFNDTRRQVPILDHEDWVDNPGQRHRAYRMYTKLRILDVMVQIIYMAQYRISELEKHKHLKPKDTVYRLVTLYTMIQPKIYKLNLYHTMMMTHEVADKKIIYPYLQLHHRLLKIYVDYCYLYWLFVRMHERHCWRNNIVMTHPVANTMKWWGWTTKKPDLPAVFTVFTQVPPLGAIKAKK